MRGDLRNNIQIGDYMHIARDDRLLKRYLIFSLMVMVISVMGRVKNWCNISRFYWSIKYDKLSKFIDL